MSSASITMTSDANVVQCDIQRDATFNAHDLLLIKLENATEAR